jgi:isopropylmalate/homocitrate/citramalate synthase
VGVVLQADQKVSLARHLDSLGVSRIEAGFARVSPEMPKRFAASGMMA